MENKTEKRFRDLPPFILFVLCVLSAGVLVLIRIWIENHIDSKIILDIYTIYASIHWIVLGWSFILVPYATIDEVLGIYDEDSQFSWTAQILLYTGPVFALARFVYYYFITKKLQQTKTF